jgi:hypothetical protein
LTKICVSKGRQAFCGGIEFPSMNQRGFDLVEYTYIKVVHGGIKCNVILQMHWTIGEYTYLCCSCLRGFPKLVDYHDDLIHCKHGR